VQLCVTKYKYRWKQLSDLVTFIKVDNARNAVVKSCDKSITTYYMYNDTSHN